MAGMSLKEDLLHGALLLYRLPYAIPGMSRESFQTENKSGLGDQEEYSVFDSIVSIFHT